MYLPFKGSLFIYFIVFNFRVKTDFNSSLKIKGLYTFFLHWHFQFQKLKLVLHK